MDLTPQVCPVRSKIQSPLRLECFPEPIPISRIGGRFLIFDIDVVTYLRRTYHICGVLIGGIPQVPQQNVFLGLPVELLPEEAKLLVEKEAAYIVDDVARHKQGFATLQGEDRRRYLGYLRSEGLQARKTAEDEARKKSEHAFVKRTALGATQKIFSNSLPSTELSEAQIAYAITLTTSASVPLPNFVEGKWEHPVSSAYPLFKHLQGQDYFIMPGLRFGCDYNVYPGDPLRFHSHFLATGYDWDQEIHLLDMIGGGRLGTGVKKAFLLGGKKQNSEADGGNRFRTFCIEWAGM